MSKTRGVECAAPATSCGTPSGWRRGGRCYRCREAHNAETNKYRGLNPRQRDGLLAALREGASPDAAAQGVGVPVQSLPAAARFDAELWAALDGQPLEVQHAARAFAFLSALVRTGGDFSRACTLTGVSLDEVRDWQKNHQVYAGMESQTLAWLDQHTRRRITFTARASDEALDKAAEVLEAGGSISAAARAAGITAQGLRKASSRHPRLLAAIPERTTPRRAGARSKLTAEVERDLREMWAIPSLSMGSIALRLGVSSDTLRRWLRDLELPARRKATRVDA